MGIIRILLIADTHLGFDLPFRPRIKRRRRGPDFFSNFKQALAPALEGKVHAVVHGGDILYRSKVPPRLVEMAFEPLKQVADKGTPVYLVPGNHERSRLPEHLFLTHDKIRIFRDPSTFTQEVGGKTLALAGFPFARGVRENFHPLLKKTGWDKVEADAHFLCAHQTFEGAQVGPVDFTFREGPDNIPPEWVPGEFTAVLSGHIHRAQQLTHTLSGEELSVPVIYPGSIERTSVAERFEEKSFTTLSLWWEKGIFFREIETHPLPARPMVKVIVAVDDYPPDQVLVHIQGQLSLIKPDAVVRVELTGQRADQVQRSISAARLRSCAPSSMNISFGLNLAVAPGN